MKKTFLSFSIIFISLLLYSCNETTGPACNNNLPTVIAQLYDCGPDVDNCNAGVLKSSEKIKVMDLFNRIRSYHKLQEISYNPDDEVYAQEAALITCSNDSMNHQPPNNVKCFSQNGYKGCDEGNLWYGSATQVYEWKSENMILDWLIDDNVETLGHRRWLLNPFMRNAAYGRVDKVLSSGRHVTAGVLKVFDRLVYAPPFESNIEYVAYPDGDYPSNAFKNDWFLSFSVVADKVDFWNNKNVDFSNSTIEMTDNNNNPISVNTVSFNTEGFGLPNIIQWKAVNLQSGVRYNVKIKKVKFQNSEKDYTYWFKLVSPI
ncbi:MAG: CAP domain-containing protein [Ignavibacteriae bacterium]|nr:CAP domain-containing protein [Ignavibacteriota bacterium]